MSWFLTGNMCIRGVWIWRIKEEIEWTQWWMIFIENLISLQRIDENLTLLLGTVNIQIRVCREISSGLYSWAVMSIGILGIAIYGILCKSVWLSHQFIFDPKLLQRGWIEKNNNDTMPGLVMEQELNCSIFMHLSLS